MAPPGAAVGPQHSPSLPSSKPTPSAATAPAPSGRARPVGSEGDWAGRSRQGQAGRVRRGNSTEAVKSMCPDVTGGVQAVGHCQDVCKQLYDTCPVPADLPRGTPPKRGGPIGSDPPKKPPFTLKRTDMRAALARGAMTLPATAAASPAVDMRLGSLQQTLRKALPLYSEPSAKGLLAANHADELASRNTTPGTGTSGMNVTRASEEQGLVINAGDSCAIRNDNCRAEIAPIHGILNRVRCCRWSCHSCTRM